jgi:hypothetical protein
MRTRCLVVTSLILLFAGAATVHASKVRTIQAAGETFVAGGTGSPNFVPVTTMLGIYWDGTTGTLDCLALAPSHSAGTAGSGTFDSNIMYVTGTIHSVTFKGSVATIEGDADCTGLGAGLGLPFTMTIQSGGPGARAVLQVSGLTFTETLISGQFSF